MSKLHAVTCEAHQQFNGNYVVFVQFSDKPSKGLRDLIKGVGRGTYRQPPPGFEKHGWHIHEPGELARAVKDKWPSFAKSLMQQRHRIRHNPEEVGQPSRGIEGPTRRGGRLEAVKV